MIGKIILSMFIAMNIWQNSAAVLLSRKAARRNAFERSPSYNHYATKRSEELAGKWLILGLF
ncbi:MAG: hypothetical protein IJQ02_12105 [Oscillospiraceae bacterium]|nr:hypothetical protein [Oscillospiraceae bacterium]